MTVSKLILFALSMIIMFIYYTSSHTPRFSLDSSIYLTDIKFNDSSYNHLYQIEPIRLLQHLISYFLNIKRAFHGTGNTNFPREYYNRNVTGSRSLIIFIHQYYKTQFSSLSLRIYLQ